MKRDAEGAPRGNPPPVDTACAAALDALWLDAARRLDIPVERDDDFGYVHWDGRVLHIATAAHLDADDTIAQLVLHEICHALIQGPERAHVPDWGLDNATDRDAVRERACLRLQAHLCGAFGLRHILYPTTVVKPFYLALPDDAFAGGDPESAAIARAAAPRAARAPFGAILRTALDDSATLTGRARHRNGHVLGAARARCGNCAFRSEGGLCRKAARRILVHGDERACARFETLPDCRECAACCRSAYDTVLLSARAPVIRKHPSLVERTGGTVRLRRAGDHCIALCAGASNSPESAHGGPWQCTIYADRPRTCRDFTRAGRNCLEARRRVGLSI